ncbi:hypothetical protein [Streptomyces sp. NPDC048248]|uniref:hypothetical protein n=1 Tax=Streptomyces sp. NPDC048248 TaxID=3365523 RepID=UPI003713E50B
MTGLSTAAQAATGTLSYTDQAGLKHEAINPTDGVRCSFDAAATGVDHFTGTDGALFTHEWCGQFFTTIRKGTSLVFGETKPKSIRLG